MKRITFFLAILFVLVGILPVQAQEPPIQPRPDNGAVYLRTHHVDVEIDNQVATTRIQQVFVNDSGTRAEGTYIFPLPRGAAVSDLVMWVNGEPINAKILSAEEARGIYEEIVRQMRDPALLEYIGQDAIQANIFPIEPYGEVKLEIEYSNILPVESGLVRYVYPLRTDQLSPYAVDDLSVRVHVKSNDKIGSVYSPSHRIAVDRDGDYEFTAGYETSYVHESGNFNLYYSLASDEIDVNLITYRESANEPGFFLLLVTPPSNIDEARVQPKDVIIVLDQSGSMYQEKWDQAREAAKYVLDNLNSEDRFNVVAFSTGWRIYANDLQRPSETEGAKQWLDTLEAIGGTDIDGALTTALDMADGERQSVVLFLTDGLATEGETDSGKILDNALTNAPDNVRIFTFGVGDDVDTFLLDQISSALHGASAYVRPTERIDEEVSALYNKVSSPVMTDIELDFGSDVVVEDMYPADPLPDLFVGSQLIIAGRFRGDGDSDITLTGKVNGERQSISYDNLEFPDHAGGEEAIPRLWATRKIGALLNSIRLHGENPELVDSIVRLSVRYGIITPYTSFLIQESDIFTEQGRRDAFSEAESNINRLDDTSSGTFAVDAADEAGAMQEAQIAAPPAAPTAPVGQAGASLPATGGGSGGPTTDADGSLSAERTEGYVGGEVIQTAGDRTFVLRDSTTWIDTTFDASSMTPIEIVFLSDEYFDLLDEYPEVGIYLALGDHVILVLDGQAYEIKPE